MAKRGLLDSAPENGRIFTCDICDPTSPMETTTAAVTVKITSISERFDNTTFADAPASNAVDQIRVGHQPSNCAIAWDRGASRGAFHRRRGDRMSCTGDANIRSTWRAARSVGRRERYGLWHHATRSAASRLALTS